MHKSVWIFLLAVLGPSAVLGWLALRSAEQQKIILERQTAELYQRETENLAAAVRGLIDEQRRSFAEAVRALLADAPTEAVARQFTGQLTQAWPRKAVGFTLDREGRLVSPAAPAALSRSDVQEVVREHGSFLWGNTSAMVYNVPVDDLTQPELLRKNKAQAENRGWSSRQQESVASRSRLGAAESAATPMPAKRRAEEPKAVQLELDDQSKLVLSPKPPGDKAAEGADRQQPMPDASASLKAAAKKPAPKSAAKPGAKAAPPDPSPEARSAAAGTLTLDDAPAAAAPRAPMVVTADGRAQKNLPASKFELAPAPAPAAEMEQVAPNFSGSSNTENNIRVVQPQQLANSIPDQRQILSNLAPSTAEFRTLYEGREEGMLTRFVQNKLALIFWLRPPQAPDLVFGCVVDAADLADLWPPVMQTLGETAREGPEFIVALLDDRARPVATAPTGMTGRDWKRPFVASEVGEALPHWETTLYLARPEQLQENARGLQRTLGFLVVVMLGAIALGGWLVVADARRQMALAQQKTDFVSNISHELKTPLTSIRMFAELMLGGRPETQAKAPQYLRIIMVEAERLTRLINNVLDFARIERHQKRFDKKPLDLHATIARIWEGHELHLRESGFDTHWEAATPPYPVVGDDDALAQILVNLLSNAEKYSAERKEIALHTYLDGGSVWVSVLDRGVGVPAGSERKIFEAFYRAHDSLSSGIQGSGLGLTLALRLAREHGGELEYRPREGGGSSFTLRIPRQRDAA